MTDDEIIASSERVLDLAIESNNHAIKANDEWAAYAHKINNDWMLTAQKALKEGFAYGFIMGVLVMIILTSIGVGIWLL